jgi:hypothetical protein
MRGICPERKMTADASFGQKGGAILTQWRVNNNHMSPASCQMEQTKKVSVFAVLGGSGFISIPFRVR